MCPALRRARLPRAAHTAPGDHEGRSTVLMGQVPWTPVIGGLAFAEAPRWHDGALFVSDIFGRQVWRVVPGEAPEVIHEVPGLPSGLGWLPDGRLGIVSMRERRLLVANPGGVSGYRSGEGGGG